MTKMRMLILTIRTRVQVNNAVVRKMSEVAEYAGLGYKMWDSKDYREPLRGLRDVYKERDGI